MINTLKYVFLSLVRNKAIMVWALAFPLVLSCLFSIMFSGLDEMGGASAIRTVIVEDAAWDDAPAFRAFVENISEGADDERLLDTTSAASRAEAERLLKESETDDSPFVGYVAVNSAGAPEVVLRTGEQLNSASMESVYQSILVTVINTFVAKSNMMADIAAVNPAALAENPAIIEAAASVPEITQKIDVTANAPKESVRFYFALLGMAAMFGAQAALTAVAALLPNTSALGARRSLGGTSRTRALCGCIIASWALSFVCLLVTYLFIKFAAGVSFVGRDLPVLAVLAVSALAATALGALIGNVPKVSLSAKSGILTGLVCFAALFAGLYGQPTMDLADTVAAAFPASTYINPAVQISQALFSIMYYDTLAPCARHVAILLAMAAVFFAAAIRFLGRQRYASI